MLNAKYMMHAKCTDWFKPKRNPQAHARYWVHINIMPNLLYRKEWLTCGNNLLICLQSAIGCYWPPLLITTTHPISHKGCVLMLRKQMVWDQSTWQPHKYVITLTTLECPKEPNLLTLFIPHPHKLASCWNATISVRCHKKKASYARWHSNRSICAQ